MNEPTVLKHGVVVHLAIGLLVLNGFDLVFSARAETPAVAIGDSGELVYATDERGNRVPDFSHCGYEGGNQSIPNVPVRIRLAPVEGDDGRRIQAAVDEVSRLPLDASGIRGAVLLSPGQFDVAGQITISASGVVLRGSGAGGGGTTVIASGTDRRALVRIAGGNDRRLIRNTVRPVTEEYVPVGERRLRLDSTNGLRPGDAIIVTRPSTTEWIKTLGMDAFGVAWKPGTRDIRWDRVITSLDGNSVTLDAPITTAIESRFGGATICRYEWPSRISQVGVEDLRLKSSYTEDRPHDEDHTWFGVVMENVENAWVRRMEFRHFAGGAVALWESTKSVTVEDCIATEPISEVGGHRRHTFFTSGQLMLFLRCWSEDGRHDFSVGHCAPGPNAFVNCVAHRALSDSGPLESWAAGVLYDNVRIDGAGLNLMNRWSTPPGAGWSAANCMLWQCRAADLGVFRPPTANNWSIGGWGHFAGDGTFESSNDFVRPLSLYQAQLHQRRGVSGAHVEPGLIEPVGSTNPTIAQSRALTARSNQPAQQLIDVIRERIRQAPAREAATTHQPSTEYRVPSTGGGSDAKSATSDVQVTSSSTPDSRHRTTASHAFASRLHVKNGWLVADGQLITGGSIQQRFWQGSTRPDEAATFGPAITRFVPGRVGTGFTDKLEEVAQQMLEDRVAVFDHHYGLWYDRRRDDHTMGRQANGDVAAPFYEQPFARSGRGQAWDGLSRYDLTKFNPWYWQRLRDFARICDAGGLVLIHQNYFQHNILEAGAHWADCPWRPANNVNDTGFPEPPPYVGDKRIFLAEQFYDVKHAHRRALHRGYIRQCLDNFSDCANVIQMTSAEYSGPVEFVQFWLDCVIEWQREHDKEVIVGLSAPKDVQDAILADSRRGPHVDVIDIRYWTYTAGNGLYAPAGGQNLTPRQHLRQTKQKPGGFSAIVKAVREYRLRYPEKAVTYYADMHCPSGRDGWAVLMGGGSLPDLRLPEELAADAPGLRPIDGIVAGPNQWCLARGNDDFLIYCENNNDSIDINLPDESDATYRVLWIDPETGDLTLADSRTVRGRLRLDQAANVLWLTRVKFAE